MRIFARIIFVIIASATLVMGGALLWADGYLRPKKIVYYPTPRFGQWTFQSIDTMKYSRDVAREKLYDPSFDAIIDRQVGAIAETGATHVAIAVPYDEEFVPFLERWVKSARTHNLKVWFRGNWSGWEGWFGYPALTRDEHIKKTGSFILAHPDLFQDGDAFSSCPECENGGPGDPRQTGDVAGHRKFLIAEYQTMQKDFEQINKDVRANFFSMNGDVARLIMNKETTKALGGIVTIDHYVKNPEQLVKDVESIAKQSGGKIILGEFGAPIPDIHGKMTETNQANWINRTLYLLNQTDDIEGVNYWLSVGGSTEIWTSDGQPREAVAVLTRHFKPTIVYGFVRDELGRPIVKASVTHADTRTTTDENGYYTLRFALPLAAPSISVRSDGYEEEAPKISGNLQEINVTLKKTQKDFLFHLLIRIKKWRDS